MPARASIGFVNHQMEYPARAKQGIAFKTGAHMAARRKRFISVRPGCIFFLSRPSPTSWERGTNALASTPFGAACARFDRPAGWGGGLVLLLSPWRSSLASPPLRPMSGMAAVGTGEAPG